MPTVNQMAAIGDTLTSSTLLQPAANAFSLPERKNNSMDTVLQSAYSIDNITPNVPGSPFNWLEGKSFAATPELVSGSLMTYRT